jgi:molybdate transport system permease protein
MLNWLRSSMGKLKAVSELFEGRHFGSMGEFGATITFVSNIPGETQTLPSAIYTLTQIPGGDVGALRLTLISIAISMLALLAAEMLARRLSRLLPAT